MSVHYSVGCNRKTLLSEKGLDTGAHYFYFSPNSIPSDKFLDSTKFKACSEKINVFETMISVFHK